MLTIITVLLFFCSIAQKNLVYRELGGAGPIVSFNYERKLLNESNLMLRGGLGYVACWSYSGITIPMGLYNLVDLNNGNFLEFGATYTFALNTEELDGPGFFLPAVGYRKFYEGKRGFFKITFSPVLFNNDPIHFLPWGGISFGARF